MIWIDFSIIALLGINLFVGLFKGLNQQAFALFASIIAVLVGNYFSKDFAVFLKTAIPDPIGRMAIAFIALWLITQMVASIVSLLLSALLKKNKLSVLDRLGGMLLGTLRGSILVTMMILLAGLSVLPKTPWWKASKLIPPFQSAAVWICDTIPSDLTKNIHYN
jgi:membrane protein required for colicin V production